MTNDYNNTANPSAKPKPLFRVHVMHRTGRYTPDNKEVFGSAREVGAVWPPRDGKKWLNVDTDIPINTRDFLIFLSPVETESNGQ